MQGAEKSISLVQGGRSEYAAALVWEKGTSGPDENVFSQWVESLKENPVVVDFKVRRKSGPGERAEVPSSSPKELPQHALAIWLRDDKRNVFLRCACTLGLVGDVQ